MVRQPAVKAARLVGWSADASGFHDVYAPMLGWSRDHDQVVSEYMAPAERNIVKSQLGTGPEQAGPCCKVTETYLQFQASRFVVY